MELIIFLKVFLAIFDISLQFFEKICYRDSHLFINPIPTSHGRNQPIYERHVTKSGQNRVKQF